MKSIYEHLLEWHDVDPDFKFINYKRTFTLSDTVHEVNSISKLIREIPSRYIGICIESSLDTIFLYLACLKVNKNPIIFNPLWGDKQLNQVIKKYNINHVISNWIIGEKIKGRAIIYYFEEILNSSKGCGIPSDIKSENDFESILFTSGSSGIPKAVCLKRSNFYESCQSWNDQINFNSKDIYTMCLPAYHISGLSILYRSIYNRFNSPRRFFTINLFNTLYNSIKQNSYFFSLVGNNCLPNKGCWQDFGGSDFTDIENKLFGDLRNLISRTKRIGQVVKIKDDIISVKLTNLNIKEDMLLQAKTIYDFTSQGPKIGIIDCEDGIKYYKGVNNSDHDLLATLQTKCEAIYKLYNLPKDSLPFANISTDPFYYQLQVIEVIDSIAITKRIKVKKPFVKVRVGDKVIID